MLNPAPHGSFKKRRNSGSRHEHSEQLWCVRSHKLFLCSRSVKFYFHLQEKNLYHCPAFSPTEQPPYTQTWNLWHTSVTCRITVRHTWCKVVSSSTSSSLVLSESHFMLQFKGADYKENIFIACCRCLNFEMFLNGQKFWLSDFRNVWVLWGSCLITKGGQNGNLMQDRGH